MKAFVLHFGRFAVSAGIVIVIVADISQVEIRKNASGFRNRIKYSLGDLNAKVAETRVQTTLVLSTVTIRYYTGRFRMCIDTFLIPELKYRRIN